MNETRDAPPGERSGSGGLLAIIDALCSVTETMSEIIRAQAEELERAKVEEEIREELRKKRDDADRQLDRIENKMRRM